LSLIISENLVQERNLNAAHIIREVSTHIQGGGGGQAFFATAGGKKNDGLTNAILSMKDSLNKD
jgi:alanyl-tRNA synthetase